MPAPFMGLNTPGKFEWVTYSPGGKPGQANRFLPALRELFSTGYPMLCSSKTLLRFLNKRALPIRRPSLRVTNGKSRKGRMVYLRAMAAATKKEEGS